MKSPIALIITDTHLNEQNIEINKSIFLQATSIAKELGLSQIEHGGDIFHSRKSQSQVTLDALDEIFEQLNKDGIKLNVVVGNHDKVNYSSHISFVKHFRYHPAVNIFSKSGMRHLTSEIDLHYLSYFSEEIYIDELKDAVSHINPTKTNVLLTHIDICGGSMNNGIVVENNITPNLFKSFDQILVGHWHDMQIMAGGQIKYIGASLQHNYGELLGKGATILYDDLSTETVPLKYPQYIKYEISPKDLTNSDIEELRKEKLESGDNIRITLVGTEAELKSFNKQSLIDAGISVEKKQDEISKQELDQRIEPFTIKSLKEEFELYCTKNKLSLEDGLRYFEKIIAA